MKSYFSSVVLAILGFSTIQAASVTSSGILRRDYEAQPAASSYEAKDAPASESAGSTNTVAEETTTEAAASVAEEKAEAKEEVKEAASSAGSSDSGYKAY